MSSAADLYLELVKRSVMGLLHEAPESLVPRFIAGDGAGPQVRPADLDARTRGRDWPRVGETMVGEARLDNLRACIETVLEDGVPGDLLEAGVWRGGASIYMRAVLEAHGVRDRTVWVADSFAGLPPPDPGYPADRDSRLHDEPDLAVSEERVRANFERYGLLDGVRFVPGWFRDSLPPAGGGPWALLRLDGDMYESTFDSLAALYPALSPGGFLIVDDWGAVPACRAAVEEYRRRERIREPIEEIDATGVFWRRSA